MGHELGDLIWEMVCDRARATGNRTQGDTLVLQARCYFEGPLALPRRHRAPRNKRGMRGAREGGSVEC